jgi:hypothetical protein
MGLKKWAVFTYIGKETRIISKLFRGTSIRIAYKTKNTIQSHLQIIENQDKYSQSGVYEIKCGSCPLRYVGQTGRNFKTRYKEHIHAIRSNNTSSKYAEHILETGHAYGKIEDTLSVMNQVRKGPLMNAWERFHIHRLTKNNLQLNDAYTDTRNPIIDLLATQYN